jgi:hypothetical protein
LLYVSTLNKTLFIYLLFIYLFIYRARFRVC